MNNNLKKINVKKQQKKNKLGMTMLRNLKNWKSVVKKECNCS